MTQSAKTNEKKRRIELLAPARDLACGIAAIDHGADAVYIGAPHFGARAAAGNSVDNIGELCRYAHQYDAKVYVTVNTIVYDAELPQVRQLLRQIADAGADAVLFQDMAIPQIVAEERLPLQLHASTQTDNRTAEKVAWLHGIGARRVVLARELSVEEIADIHRQVPDVELEVFVHGALCVSYSGQCYASQHCFRRSANRGECAQVCRMKFDLEDSEGHVLIHGRHLLSLKDLNQSEHLEELIEAGATSLKIEGRLKDMVYVKNVTAAYSQLLDRFIARHPDNYERASMGHCRYTFTPDLAKTFNRGYTTYFLHGRQPDIFSPDTPKALGECVGTVKSISRGSIVVAGTAAFANGDGLCFFDASRRLQGFRVNRAEGNRLSVSQVPPTLRQGTRLYRNNDQALERLLSRNSAERKISVIMTLTTTDTGFALTIDNGRKQTSATVECEHQQAQKPQQEYIIRELKKLGNTPYDCAEVKLPPQFGLFIPANRLSELRRKAIQIFGNHDHDSLVQPPVSIPRSQVPSPNYSVDYLYNASNDIAREFYAQQGAATAKAFELAEPDGEKILMQCRHCLRYALGHCTRHGGTAPQWQEPLFLRLENGRRFRLRFNCKECNMEVVRE